jgi:hypothetical protein
MISTEAPAGGHFRCLQSGMVTCVIIDQHLFAGFDVAGNQIPARDHQIVATFQNLGVRQAAGGDDHHIGLFGQHVLGFSPGVEAEFDVARRTLRHAPLDDADHLLAALVQRGQPDLAAGVGLRLEHRDLVPALGGDTGGLEARRPGTDDHDALRGLGTRDRVRHGEFTAGGRIVNAQRVTGLVDPVEAIGGADTGADVVLAAFHDLS